LPAPVLGDGEPELLFSPNQMAENEDWIESSVISAPDGASRIGMLLDLNLHVSNSDIEQHIQVRGFNIQGQPLPWAAVEVTYSEDFSIVARFDPAAAVFGAQMRVPKSKSSHMSHITFSAVVPEPPGQESESAGDGSPNLKQHKSALSVSQLVNPRSSWNAKATQCTSYDPGKTKMAIHHTVTPPSSAGGYASRIRGMQAYHMDVRGWCDIGYHYLVSQDGSLWEGRPIKHRGAHVANHNSGNIGISFVGCFQSGSCSSMGNIVPSESSLIAGSKLITALSSQYGIPQSPDKIKGHQEHSGAWTSCPGDNLLSRINEMLENNITPEAIAPPAPASGTGTLTGIVWDSSVTSSPNDPNALKLKNASVSVLGVSTSPVNAQTGGFEFELPAGLYSLIVNAPGYQSKSVLVTVQNDQKTWNSVGLSPVATPAPEPEPEEVNQPGPPQACYPGANNTWDVCFALTPKSQLGVSGYNYPAGGPNSQQYTTPSYFLNLETAYSETKLAKNFVLNEFMQSYKGKFAVFSPKAVAHWQTIRNLLGTALYINSGYRNPKYNAGLDGTATYSRHMFGDAADVTAKGAASLNSIKNKCNAEGADYVSVYTSHVHCDWRNDALDKGFWAGSGAAKPGAHQHRNETDATAWVELSTHQAKKDHAVFARMRHSGFDEGIPWVKWHLVGPNIDRVVEASESFAFVPQKSGTYRLQWEVAGYLMGQETIHLP